MIHSAIIFDIYAYIRHIQFITFGPSAMMILICLDLHALSTTFILHSRYHCYCCYHLLYLVLKALNSLFVVLGFIMLIFKIACNRSYLYIRFFRSPFFSYSGILLRNVQLAYIRSIVFYIHEELPFDILLFIVLDVVYGYSLPKNFLPLQPTSTILLLFKPNFSSFLCHKINKCIGWTSLLPFIPQTCGPFNIFEHNF